MNILIPVLAVAVIGLICGIGLSVASSVMKVEEDARFPVLRECLPGANCGACGFSGCDGYATALLEPETKTNLCVPGGADTAARLAKVLGVETEDVARKAALVHCQGTCEATHIRHDYRGIQSCAAAKLFFGGAGSCIYGCLGLGDCEKVCPQNAISMKDGIASIRVTSCVGCGLCASTCPQKVIEIVSGQVSPVVLCSNHDKGAVTRKNCSNGCIACRKCERNCEHGAITIVANLPVIDYEKCVGCGKCSEGCPTGALVV